jgi:hypothetical protein
MLMYAADAVSTSPGVSQATGIAPLLQHARSSLVVIARLRIF